MKCKYCAEQKLEPTTIWNLANHLFGEHIRSCEIELDDIRRDYLHKPQLLDYIVRLTQRHMPRTINALDVHNYLHSDSKLRLCREERNYAALLYHKLLCCHERIIRALGIEGSIQLAVFEATFLRDIWNANRELFAQQLCGFLNIEGMTEASYHLHPSRWQQTNPGYQHRDRLARARRMMSAKPDIAVIDDDSRLYFYECKYESGIARYDENENQLTLQNQIHAFLVKNYRMFKPPYPVQIIQFTDDGDTIGDIDVEMDGQWEHQLTIPIPLLLL